MEINFFQESNRSAIPDFSTINFDSCYWIFNLVNLDDHREFKFSSENLNQNSASSFILPLFAGNWSIFTIGYLENNYDDSNQILHSQEQVFFIGENGFYELELAVELIVQKGYGKVDLLLQVDNPEITDLVVSNSSSDLDGVYKKESNFFHLQSDKIGAGTYDLILQFIDQNGFCFVCREIINVRNNCITNTWTKNSEKSIDAIKDNILILKDDLFLQSKIYFVKGQNGLLDNNNIIQSNESAKSGSLLNPFDSLQDAIDTIAEKNDQLSSYEIYIDGIISPKDDYVFSESQNNSFLNLTSENLLNLKICGLNSNAKIDAKGSRENPGRVMYIGNNVRLYLENLKITGGFSIEDGSGIYLSAELPLEENVYNLVLGASVSICENQTEASGGGLFIDKGKVKIEGKNSYICHNIARSKGGGICLFGLSDKTARILDARGGNIFGNTAISSTGKNGVGGGIYTQFATVDLENTIISENMAANGGGIGIAQNSIINLQKSKVIGNLASYEKGKGGGGIFASGVSSKLYLKNGTEILNNDSSSLANKGGGISATSTDLYIFDKVQVINNTCYQTEISNLSSTFSKLLNIEEELNYTKIGITTMEFEDLPITFTKKFGNQNFQDVNSFFFADNDSYSIMMSEIREGVIVQNPSFDE